MTSTTNVRPSRGVRDKSQKTNFELSKMTDGPSSKIQPTAEQIRLAQMINIAKDTDEPELQLKVKQVMELTGKSSDEASVALHDCDNDPTRAINMLLEGESDQGEWELTMKRKKSRQANSQLIADVAPNIPANNKENRNRTEKGKEREPRDREGIRNRGPPRLNRGRVRDAEKNERNLENNFSRERSSDRRGRGSRIINGPGRRGRGRGSGGRIRTFQNRSTSRSEFPRSIDTWTNVQPESTDSGDPPMCVGNWADSFPPAEDWDNEDWTGSLSETKVFTPSTTLANSDFTSSNVSLINQSSVDPSPSVQQSSTTPDEVSLSNALQSVRHVSSNNVGFGQSEVVSVDLPISSTVVNTISSASKSSPYTALTITSNGASSLSSAAVLSDASSNGTMQAQVSSKLPATPPGTALTVALGSSSRGLNASILNTGHPQHSLPVRPRSQRPRNLVASRIPSSAVEMPDDAITALDVQFGSLEFGSEPSSLGFGGLLDNAVTSTTSMSNHIGTNSSQTASSSSCLGSSTLHMSSQLSKGGNDLSVADPSPSSFPAPASMMPTAKELPQAVSQQTTTQQPVPDPSSFVAAAERKPFNGQRTVSSSVLDGAKAGDSTSVSSYVVQNNSVNSHSNFQSTYGGHKPSTFSHHHSLSTPVTQSPSSLYGSSVASQVQVSTPFSSVTPASGYGVSQTQGSYSAQSQPSVYANPVSTVSTYASGSSISQTGYPSQNHSGLHTSAVVNSKLNSSHATVKDSMESSSMQHSYDTSHTTSTPGLNSTLTTASSSLGLSSGSLSSTNMTAAKTSISSSKAGVPNLQPGLPTLLSHQYIMGQAGLPFYSLPQTMYTYEDLQLLQQRIPPMASYYDMSFQPSTNMTGRDGGLASAYTGADGKFSRGDNSSPVPTTLSQQQSSTQQHQQTFISPTALPHGYSYYYPGGVVSGFPQYGTPIFPVPPATNAHGASNNTHFQKPSAYGSHTYSTGYESLGQNQDYAKTSYGSSTQNQAKGMVGTSGSGSANSVSGNDLTASVYSKAHSQMNKQPYDKPGFHAGTPPPFNLAGTQSGPLGAPSTAYAATPFITMMAQHPSPMLHHQLHQDAASTSQRPNPTQTQNKTSSATKQGYTASYWASS